MSQSNRHLLQKSLLSIALGILCLTCFQQTSLARTAENAPALPDTDPRGGFQVGNGKLKVIANKDALWKTLVPSTWSTVINNHWTRIISPDKTVQIEIDVVAMESLESTKDLVKKWIEEDGWALVKLGRITAIQSIKAESQQERKLEIQAFRSSGEAIVLNIEADRKSVDAHTLQQVQHLLDSFEVLVN